ncbi:hypothetical protein F4808DRAFT_286060 [Astrocystis sublimbata]|nr:hypothetical protein F4808DRAFT_286060 [Astrocystis sublimbata]
MRVCVCVCVCALMGNRWARLVDYTGSRMRRRQVWFNSRDQGLLGDERGVVACVDGNKYLSRCSHVHTLLYTIPPCVSVIEQSIMHGLPSGWTT